MRPPAAYCGNPAYRSATGVAKDSLPDGSQFAAGLDDKGKTIVEVMTMYRDGDWAKPVQVTFIYGRAKGGDLYGWIARANVGEL
jgi:hypothetical protein